MKNERSLRQSMTALYLALRVTHLKSLLTKANFDPDQPRLPRGSPGGGRWTDTGGSHHDFARSARERSHDLGISVDEHYEVAATCAEHIAAACKGLVLREFPSQYLDMEIDDVRRDAASGSAAARKALKLMFDKRFQK